MDRDRFDALTRLFAARGSRRLALAALLGAAIFGHDRDDAEVKRRGKERGKTRGHDRGRDERNGAKQQHAARRKTRSQAVPASCFTGSPCRLGPNTDLAKCDFAKQDLPRDLRRSNLKNANLANADGSGTDFGGANLGGACLVDADLTGATITGTTNINGAIFCRTRMPNGSINNSGCNKATTCCPTCQELGGPCGGSLGGSCCGGTSCESGVCRCPASRPANCNGVCRGCCTDADCPSGSCCGGSCCASGLVCDERPNPHVCCTPDSRELTCGIGTENPKCGRVENRCGRSVDCPDCAPVSCRSVVCNANTCQVTGNAPNLEPCTTAAGESGVCCGGTCVPGACCDNGDCRSTGNICVPGARSGNQCQCGANPPCAAPTGTCCDAPPSGTCVDTATDENHCGRCGNVCTPGRAPDCVGGACVCASNGNQLCPAGTTCCAGGCADRQSDPRNCGGCGTTCTAPRPNCCGGNCRECCADSQCPNAAAPVCLEFACVDQQVAQTFARLRPLIALYLGVDEAIITMASDFRNDLGAESLDFVELILAVEEEFGIVVRDEDVDGIDTVGDAVRYIIANGG